jgi:hypothetical protein
MIIELKDDGNRQILINQSESQCEERENSYSMNSIHSGIKHNSQIQIQ